MDPGPKGKYPIIPAISFRLPDLWTSDGVLKNVPTYISSVVSDGIRTSIDGKLNGQPFSAVWHVSFTIAPRIPNEALYLWLNFPQQSVAFYERRLGDDGPAFAINYTNREAEERDGERRKVISIHLHDHAPKGRYVFDTDPEIDREHLEKLKRIVAYLKPTINMWRKISKVNAVILMDSRGQGTLESLVVPRSE